MYTKRCVTSSYLNSYMFVLFPIKNFYTSSSFYRHAVCDLRATVLDFIEYAL